MYELITGDDKVWYPDEWWALSYQKISVNAKTKKKQKPIKLLAFKFHGLAL